MGSQFTSNKDLEQPANGDYNDRWQIPVNRDWTFVDAALGQTIVFNATAGSQTLSQSSASNEIDLYSYVPLFITITGAISNAVTYTIPSGVGGIWVIRNVTTDGDESGPYVITVDYAGGGTSVVIPRGEATMVCCDTTTSSVIRGIYKVSAAAGLTGDIQYNADGSFAGSNTFTYDAEKDNMSIGGTVAMGSSFKRNRIINGNMLVNQRATTVTTDLSYSVDRWKIAATTSGAFTAAQSTNAPVGFTNSLLFVKTTGSSPLAGNANNIIQYIEGYNVADLYWGTEFAKNVTLSFWVSAGATGTFSGAIRNANANRSYPFTYTIADADTWTYASVTIPGDTAGTWATNNTTGMQVLFSLGTGTSYSGPADEWAATNYTAATGTSLYPTSTSGGTFYVTGVQLEVGTKATPYEMQIYSDQLAQCQRYYYKLKAATTYANAGFGLAYTTTDAAVSLGLPVSMRAAPNGSYSALADWQDTGGIPTAMNPAGQYSADYRWMTIQLTGTYIAAGPVVLNANNTTSAYIAWDAELT